MGTLDQTSNVHTVEEGGNAAVVVRESRRENAWRSGYLAGLNVVQRKSKRVSGTATRLSLGSVLRDERMHAWLQHSRPTLGAERIVLSRHLAGGQHIEERGLAACVEARDSAETDIREQAGWQSAYPTLGSPTIPI